MISVYGNKPADKNVALCGLLIYESCLIAFVCFVYNCEEGGVGDGGGGVGGGGWWWVVEQAKCCS